MDENEIQDNQTCLCISDGFTIFCLDLKLAKAAELQEHTKDLQSLPIMSAMNFGDEGFPISMGLFKLGSDVYMVGGHHFSGEPDLWSLNSLRDIYSKYPVKCPSSKTYSVSLADDGRRISLSECKNIGELNKPKLWPIVVDLDGKINVIESLPPYINLNSMQSHEVLTNNDHDQSQGWMELSPTCVSHIPFWGGECYYEHTWYHFSVGDRIYSCGSLSNRFEVFDFQACKWELHGYPNHFNQYPGLYSVKHVGQLVSFGYGHCVGRFRHKESDRDPLYVVIAIGKVTCVSAAAYLVTSSGQVVCYQRLPLFFGRVSLPMSGVKRPVISVADAEGKTMCAVVEGWLGNFNFGLMNDLGQRFLHISTFTVEEVGGSDALVSSLWAVRRDVNRIDKLPFALEKYFVNVVTKDSYAFKLSEADMRVAGTRLSACFL